MSKEQDKALPGPVLRRRKNPEAKAAFRDEVVAIARQLFAEEGFGSVSLRTIAARAGCSPMTLYVYFPNKLALLRFIWADIFKAAFAETEAAMAVQGDAVTKLRAYGQAWMRYWLCHPENYRVVFLNQDTGTTEPHPDVDGMDQPFFADGALAVAHLQLVAGVFAEGMATGQLREMPPEQGVQVLITQLLGLAHGLITMPEFNWGPAEVLCEAAMEASLRGFMAAPQTPGAA